ncbi:hypothetical protein J3A72_000481 [Stenotrophomonas sp. PvP093]|uniref:hypothetical protein n=1 Tax=unclassified Stenotrophomonas TaxID=196198 RepID=UPI001AE6AF3A|nr:hypothetical protein [Stenotrophomonas sp. PvP093]MBP2480189.1 hypothetical protein [Stenotrophomonas sp. PvP093]
MSTKANKDATGHRFTARMDTEVWQSLRVLAIKSGKTFQEVLEEAAKAHLKAQAAPTPETKKKGTK